MGLLGSIFSSSSSSSSKVYDQRAGVDGSGTAVSKPRVDGGGSLIIGSDEIAAAAIAASNQALDSSVNFVSEVFTEFLNVTDKRFDRADKNNAAIQQFAGEIISKEQEGSDDRLIKIITYALIGGVAIVAIRSGAVKSIVGAFT